jgi:glycosyltransferase involved in cell wall biosynthesis
MQWLKNIWNIDNTRSVIVNPAVGLMPQQKKDKTNSIFVCSRIEHSKNIEILIDTYLSCEFLKETCKLIIAGSVIEETASYAAQICNMIQNYQNFVVLHENPSRVEIEDYFNDAKIFWHAKGYQVDEETNPYELEHFGITTVEAMSAGCVPVVINKGGQKEIIDNGVNGFRWDTPEELIEKTIYLLQHDEERKKMAACAVHRANNFSLDKFTQNLNNALSRSKQ